VPPSAGTRLFSEFFPAAPPCARRDDENLEAVRRRVAACREDSHNGRKVSMRGWFGSLRRRRNATAGQLIIFRKSFRPPRSGWKDRASRAPRNSRVIGSHYTSAGCLTETQSLSLSLSLCFSCSFCSSTSLFFSVDTFRCYDARERKIRFEPFRRAIRSVETLGRSLSRDGKGRKRVRGTADPRWLRLLGGAITRRILSSHASRRGGRDSYLIKFRAKQTHVYERIRRTRCGSLQRHSANRAKGITLIPRRTGRETREDDTSNKSDDRKREKGGIVGRRGRGGEGRGRQKERETFCCA